MQPMIRNCVGRALLGSILGLLLWSGWARTQEPLSLKGMGVRLLKQAPPFLVAVDVDHLNRVYEEGDVVQVTVRSGCAGHLYLFYFDANGDGTCVFPNAGRANSQVPALQPTIVPCQKDPEFEFVIQGPFGRELLKAIVTEEPLKSLPVDDLQQKLTTPVDVQKFAAVIRELHTAPFRWGEGDVKITTQPRVLQAPANPRQVEAMPQPPADPPQVVVAAQATDIKAHAQQRVAGPVVAAGQPERWGLFVGISRFQEPPLLLPETARFNAQVAAATMQKQCGLTARPIMLLDEQATLEGIRHAITHELSEQCRPGDDVFIYWSGRLGALPQPCSADDTRAEGGGWRPCEYLVPHDGALNDPASLILETTMTRWLQRLDRCNVSIILDTCLAESRPRPDSKTNRAHSQFLTTELVRAKSLGELNVVLLSTCCDERELFSGDPGMHSPMTKVYLETLSQDAGPLTLYDAFQALRDREIPTTLNDTGLAKKIRLRD